MMTQGSYVPQTSETGDPAMEQKKLYRNSLDCLQKIVKQEGISRGLYAGLSVNLIRGFSGSILLVGYDELKRLLQL
jgi:hypothetical protein